MTKTEFEDLEVGKTFEMGCRKLKVVGSEYYCNGCIFYNFNCTKLQIKNFIPWCSEKFRKDHKHVIFIEVEDEDL